MKGAYTTEIATGLLGGWSKVMCAHSNYLVWLFPGNLAILRLNSALIFREVRTINVSLVTSCCHMVVVAAVCVDCFTLPWHTPRGLPQEMRKETEVPFAAKRWESDRSQKPIVSLQFGHNSIQLRSPPIYLLNQSSKQHPPILLSGTIAGRGSPPACLTSHLQSLKPQG